MSAIAWVRVSSCTLPLATPISDAKVLIGRQTPMTEIAMLFAEVETADSHSGLGFSYSKRAGGPGLMLGPHFAMELHVHLGAAYPTEPWVEHFDWLEPLFNERLEIKNGRMIVPTRPGLGVSLSEQAKAWTREAAEVGKRA